MTTNEYRRMVGKRRRDIALLILLCIVLLCSIIAVIRRMQQEDTPPPDSTLLSVTDPTDAAVTTQPGSTPAQTTPPAAVPSETVLTSATGLLHADTPHIYIRIGHEKPVAITYGSGVDRTAVTWQSGDPQLLSVSPDGNITGLAKGDCMLTVRYGEEFLEIPVTVRELRTEDGCTYVDDILIANKTYSLPSTYDPGMLPVTQEAFDALAAAAKEEGLDIYIGSGYRDYDFQVTVYQSMVDGYSKEYADAVSARPGHSEHQTGYTVDCNTIDEAFGETDEGRWLAAHCHEYGFIIRYPADKVDITGYDYEPWHIRYIGKEAAKEVFEQDISLEEYLDVDSVYQE